MTEEEKKFAIKINVDKAIIKTYGAFACITISLLTYLVPIIMGDFDFGIVFEIVSLVLLIIAKLYMDKYDQVASQRFVNYAMFSAGWIIVYDAISFITAIQDAYDAAMFGYGFYIGEFFLITYLADLFAIKNDLLKADNPERYKESTDWFYEKYEDDENKK